MENEIHKRSRLATLIKKDTQVGFLVINSSSTREQSNQWPGTRLKTENET